MARALGLVEQRDVDLDPKDLVHAAHVARPRLLVVVEVEVRAIRRDAPGRVQHAVAERAALAALAGLRHREGIAHPSSVTLSAL